MSSPTSNNPNPKALEDLNSLSKSPNTKASIPTPSFSWKTRILLPLLVIGTIVALFLKTGYEAFLPAIPVQAAPVIAKQIQGAAPKSAVVQAAGWLEANPYLIHISALADGVIKNVLVLEGEPIQKDQLLVHLIDEDAKLELRRAEAVLLEKEGDLAVAQAKLKAAQKLWDTLTERKRALAIAKSQGMEMKAMLKKAEAEIGVEQALLKKVESDYERTKPLIKGNAASEADLITSEALYLAQKAKLEVALQNVHVIQESIKRLETESEAAEEQLKLKIGELQALEEAQAQVKIAQAALANATAIRDEKMLQLQRMEIRSPIEGVIVKRYVEPGSKVLRTVDHPHSAYLFSVYNPKHFQVRVDVPLADVALIKAGQPTEIIVEVLPDQVFSGTVTRIIHEANIQKNTLEVKVALQEPRSELRPEMLARVRFLPQTAVESSKEIRESFMARTETIQSQSKDSDSAYVWIIARYDGRYGFAMKRSIRVGTFKQEGWVEILEGLNMGDLLIVSPPSTLQEGSRIEVTGELSS